VNSESLKELVKKPTRLEMSKFSIIKNNNVLSNIALVISWT